MLNLFFVSSQLVYDLVDAFNLYTFKIIINMYDPITMIFIDLGLFTVGLCLLLCFLHREVPLAFVVKLVYWCWTLLTFTCLERFLFFHQIWMRVLLGNPGCKFFSFITLNISCHSLLVCRLSVEKSTDNLMVVPLYVVSLFSLAAFNLISLSMCFFSLITMCPVCSSFG